jgi:ankyrin repeat protein
MPSEEAQSVLMEAVCNPDDAAAIADIDAALELGADFTSDRVVPLWYATLRDSTRVLEHLMSLGASAITEPFERMCSAIHEAAERGREDMLQRLLVNVSPAHLDTLYDYIERTPLAAAAYEGQMSTVRFLLDFGMAVDGRHENFAADSPLAHAIMQGRLDVAKYLLERGADPEASGWMHITPRMRAKDAGPAFVRLFEGK